MPPITRYFVKASFIALALALVAGIWAQIPAAAIPGLHSVYTHLLTYGWLTQLIFGVALWMFPVFNKQTPRGPAWLGWACFATLNAGLYLRVIFEPLHIRLDNPLTAWMLVLSALLQWLAGLTFVLLAWTRVRER